MSVNCLVSVDTLTVYKHCLVSVDTLTMYKHCLVSVDTLTMYKHCLVSVDTLTMYKHWSVSTHWQCTSTTKLRKMRSLRHALNTFDILSVSLSLFLCLFLSILTAIFPGGPGLAGTKMSPFWILMELRMMEVTVTTGAIRCAKLQSKCHHQQTKTQFF